MVCQNVMPSISPTIQEQSSNGVGKKRQCHLCARTFTKTEHLERHVRSHTKEKPFRCTECGKCYGRHDTLLRHQRDHAKEKDLSSEATSVAPTPQLDGVTPTVLPGLAPMTSGSSHQSPVTELLSQPSEMGSWNVEFDSQFPPWLLDEDFDIGMLDTPIAATMAELAPGWLHVPRKTSNTGKPITSLKHLWFTCMNDPLPSLPASGAATPRTLPQGEVDEEYRRSLHRRLLVRPSDQSLPSSDFLNLCVRLYFARFSPVFPVVHAASFRPSATNSMLLLSICSVGSLFTGSVNATSQGVQIFERLNKAVLATWERLIGREASEVVPMIQAALIGQTFGLLSGDPKHLAIVDSFHGTVIAWARRRNIFSARHTPTVLQGLDAESLDKRWKDWAKTEELIRIVLGLHIHDAELADIFHHEPFLRHGTRQLPLAASKALFTASSAREWASLYDIESFTENLPYPGSRSLGTPGVHDLEAIPFNCRFTAYAALAGIAATIVENRSMGQLDIFLTERIQETLIAFYARYLSSLSPFEPDNLGITVLWHLTFMALHVDFDLLERAVGRDGGIMDPDTTASVAAWASSRQAKRCVTHASLIQKKLEALSVGFEPAIHVPRAMFLAALSWYCYTRYGTDTGSEEMSAQGALDFPEMQLLKVNPAMLLFEANGFKLGKPAAVEASGALCGLTDLLQRIGHWEIARKFGSILGALIHNETDPNG